MLSQNVWRGGGGGGGRRASQQQQKQHQEEVESTSSEISRSLFLLLLLVFIASLMLRLGLGSHTLSLPESVACIITAEFGDQRIYHRTAEIEGHCLGGGGGGLAVVPGAMSEIN